MSLPALLAVLVAVVALVGNLSLHKIQEGEKLLNFYCQLYFFSFFFLRILMALFSQIFWRQILIYAIAADANTMV